MDKFDLYTLLIFSALDLFLGTFIKFHTAFTFGYLLAELYKQVINKN